MARKSRKNTESVTAPVQESTFYATAIYVRLSIENSGKDYDGDSIANQISFCKNYLAEQTDLQARMRMINRVKKQWSYINI